MQQQESIIAHLIGIVESIEADLMLPLRAHERENRGGFLSISRQVFCYVDYLGALADSGENSTKNAVNYMKKYFTRANPAYKNKCSLIYSMWRHGTVHEYDPKIYASEAIGFRLRWGANNTSLIHNRKWHLKCLCRDSQPGCYHWFINLFELVDELRKSVMYFATDLEKDEQHLAKVRQNLKKLSTDIDLDKQKPDLLSQAKAVVEAAAGVIDDRGQVIRVFKDATERDKFIAEEWGKQPLT
jgi:hypothetical protein